MPKKYRLSRADFTHTRQLSRLPGVLFNVSYGIIPGRGSGGACVVSNKVASTAVARNRIRRHARVALLALLPKRKPMILILHAKKGAEKASPDEIRAEILELSTKLPQSA